MRNTKDYPLVVDEWDDSLEGDFLWSNTNFGEAVTETMTPLTWALIQFTLEDWVFLPGLSTVGAPFLTRLSWRGNWASLL